MLLFVIRHVEVYTTTKLLQFSYTRAHGLNGLRSKLKVPTAPGQSLDASLEVVCSSEEETGRPHAYENQM